MKPLQDFANQPPRFWASVRTLSQRLGYSKKGGRLIIPKPAELVQAFEALDLDPKSLADGDGVTKFGRDLAAYFEARAEILTSQVEPKLMDTDDARAIYERLLADGAFKCAQPMNKQKGAKRSPAYFTCIINMLIEANIGELECDYDPQQLTTFTEGGVPIRTLARRVDGAFPSPVNPVAVWEIKEYYYTTTFGSRVAGGVYETLLDGLELKELRDEEGVPALHYLMIDSHNTWWNCGKSYLCRIVDMLHMGYVDEVLVGREVVDRLPLLAREWAETAASHGKANEPAAELSH